MVSKGMGVKGEHSKEWVSETEDSETEASRTKDSKPSPLKLMILS